MIKLKAVEYLEALLRGLFIELYRVLDENGKLHIADFGRSGSGFQRLLFNIIRRLDGYKSTDANAKGLMPLLISNAGFQNAVIGKTYKTLFGEVQLFSAVKNVTLKQKK